MKILYVMIAVLGLMVLTAVAENPSALTLVETGGAIGADNLAGKGTAFAWDDMSARYGNHATVNLNDGKYGNNNSWIGAGLPPAAVATSGFVGIAFKEPVSIGGIAWGRDNQDQFKDRCIGTYTVQYTAALNPGKDTPASEWKTIGTITYDDKTVTPNLRHKYRFAEPVTATAILLLVPIVWSTGAGTCIDELEIYSKF